MLTNILQNIRNMELFQLLKLLDSLDVQYKIIPSKYLTFPSTDICSLKVVSSKAVIITTTYSGLYGVDALSQNYQVSMGQRKFLDIFNNHIYKLIYASWKKHKIFNKDNNLVKNYCNALNFTNNNLCDLGIKLKALFPEMGVMIKQFVGRWENIETNSTLCLGNNIVLGNRVFNLCFTIEVNIKAHNHENVNELLAVIKKHVSDTIKLQINLQINCIKNIYLGWGFKISGHSNSSCCCL